MRKVETPIMAPRRCLFCITGYKGGPVVDTMLDHVLPPVGRVYICLEHAKLIGVAAGYVEGDEADKLRKAAELVATAQADVVKRDQIIGSLRNQIGAQDKTIATLERERADALGRADQAEAKLAEVAGDLAATAQAVRRPDYSEVT